MSSRTLGKHQAHQSRSIDAAQLLRRFVLAIVPLSGLKTERERVASIFGAVHGQIDEVQTAFGEKSNPDLRDWAVEPNSKIPDYDPHETVIEILSLPEKILGWLLLLSKATTWIGIILAIKVLHSLGLSGIELVTTVKGIVPLSVIVLGPVYLWFLRADTFIHQSVAKELRAGPAMVTSRRRSEIVGYGVWNRSLLGQTGLFLVGFFYLADSLAHLPVTKRWCDDPAGYVENRITGNIDLLYNADGKWEAGKKLYGRLLKTV